MSFKNGVKKMTPTRTEIETCARQLWHRDRARSGDPSFEIEPEISELSEGGYLSSARSELMTNTETKNMQWLKTSENAETSAFTVDIDTLFDSGALILGSKHTGKSDIAMIVSDKAIRKNAVVVVFDPSQDWIARSSIKQYVKVEPYRNLDVPCESTIFDISLLSPNEERRTVESFSEKLFQSQASNPECTRYLIVFEEAHTYFTQGCMRSENLANCVRMLSVGRNVSIACVLISQFASMLDKFAVKHSTSQMWCGFTREPNDIKYLRQILGSDAEKLSKLSDGQFLYLTRNGLSKIAIEPYESLTQKQKIALPQIKSIEPIKTNQNVSITPFLKLGMILFFMVLLLLLGVRI
jgi:hypothetical protein